MTTRADEVMERDLDALGISVYRRGPIAMACPVPGDEHRRTQTDTDLHRGNGKAERVVGLVCGQVKELQGWLDSSFAVSVSVSYNAEKLSEEYSVPAGEILRAVRRERQTGRLPGDMVLTSDHRALITLSATVRE